MRASEEALFRLRKAIDELAAAIAEELLERSRVEVGAPAPVQLGWYVYGVVAAPGPVLPDDLPGVDPLHAPLIVVEDDLAAVASQVSLAEFDDEPLRKRLEDPEWLERRARTHECVLDVVAALTTVIPMRMCTVYRTESALRRMLVREHGPLAEGLDRFAGKAEWAVTILAREGARELPPPGRHELHGRLAAVAAAALVNRAVDPEVVLNGAYLVSEGAVGDLRESVAMLRTEYEPLGYDVLLTGPAAPYTFVRGSIEAVW